MQSIPIYELPTGQYVYQERGGTYSHPKPGTSHWCERHSTVEEAVRCFQMQLDESQKSDK